MAGQYIKKQVKKRFDIVWNSIKHIPYNIRRFYNKTRIKSRNFTVISNNCWAGKVYQYLDMPYLSPTVGLYFFADDYIRFLKNLKHYMSLDLKFIGYKDSKHSDVLVEHNQTEIPIGVLDDVEIIFLHYKTEEEAYEKWNRRKSRINWDNLYIKFSKMNQCTEKHIKEFSELPFEKKILLGTRKNPKYRCEVFWNGKTDLNGQILLDTIPFPGNIKLSSFIK